MTHHPYHFRLSPSSAGSDVLKVNGFNPVYNFSIAIGTNSVSGMNCSEEYGRSHQYFDIAATAVAVMLLLSSLLPPPLSHTAT